MRLSHSQHSRRKENTLSQSMGMDTAFRPKIILLWQRWVYTKRKVEAKQGSKKEKKSCGDESMSRVREAPKSTSCNDEGLWLEAHSKGEPGDNVLDGEKEKTSTLSSGRTCRNHGKGGRAPHD